MRYGDERAGPRFEQDKGRATEEHCLNEARTTPHRVNDRGPALQWRTGTC